MVNLLLVGLVAGLLASLVMGAVSQGFLRDQPMPAQLFASEFVTDDPPEESEGPAWVVHVLYGTVAGVVFVLLFAPLTGLTDLPLLWVVGYGLVWGLLLWAGAYLWLTVLGLREMQRARADDRMAEGNIMLLTHTVYGIVLGVIVGLAVSPAVLA